MKCILCIYLLDELSDDNSIEEVVTKTKKKRTDKQTFQNDSPLVHSESSPKKCKRRPNETNEADKNSREEIISGRIELECSLEENEPGRQTEDCFPTTPTVNYVENLVEIGKKLTLLTPPVTPDGKKAFQVSPSFPSKYHEAYIISEGHR